MSTTSQSYLAGLIGTGVTPSLTPAMHEAEADHHGLRCVYRPIDLTVLNRPATDVADLVRAGAALGFNAFNITHPCKQIVLSALDEVAGRAESLGAVNTVVVRDGRLLGYNTDVTGFGWALAAGLTDPDLSRVVQFGTGGAGAAVSYALLEAGVERLDLVDVDPERAQAQAHRLADFFPDAAVQAHEVGAAPDLVPAASGIVNATPIGMADHPGTSVDLDLLHARHWVADIVYRPLQTALVVGARERGCAVLDGGWMATGQAVDAFELMTGLTPDAGRMRSHFLELIAQGH
ncbi:shikimate dehydrogenase [Kineosphaera limosa]|uniref:Shikimate dehydrogenase n=1 Tax=Kineosphaera limosa NBRC 100340 TaxID=1184609 RepID=K6WN67_9MICO|nr:shikimate dehydrogenase [Kineosphaera limosa]NYE02143.1 shikimate dehydrogenase [Kineosphaera limosa]GAB95256.1 shikimate dehydrogenase [Kineosphaera limosa NBRC 100340]